MNITKVREKYSGEDLLLTPVLARFTRRRGGIGLCLKPTFSTLMLISVVVAGRKLPGNERFRKSSISAFQNTKNY